LSFEGVPSIPVDWMRTAMHAIQRGPVTGERCVVIMDGVDTLLKESANTMLKTLEEPPLNTVILLMTQRFYAVLPTIISRCQTIRFGYLTPDEIRGGIDQKAGGEIAGEVRERAVQLSTGSLGRALSTIASPESESESISREFWALSVEQDWLRLGATIDGIAAKQDIDFCSKVFIQIAFRVRDSVLGGCGGTENYILNIKAVDDSGIVRLSPGAASQILRGCQSAISALESHGNISLVLVNFALSIPEILNEQEQQVGGGGF
jgi:hypothetical protein